MKYFLFIILLSSNAWAKQLKVAIIDTGAPKQELRRPCYQAYNFTAAKTVDDTHGHGSNIAGLIEKHAKDADYCPVYMKYYDPKSPGNNLENTIKALRASIAIEVDVIVYAGGGTDYSAEEAALIKAALDKKIVVIVAAGNESLDLGKKCDYFPACSDSRVIVVGCLDKAGKHCRSSSKGSRVDLWDQGEDQEAFGITLSGTSQATGNIAGKFVKFLHKIGGIK